MFFCKIGFFIIKPLRPELLIKLSNFSRFSSFCPSLDNLYNYPSSNLNVLFASYEPLYRKLTLSFWILATDFRFLTSFSFKTHFSSTFEATLLFSSLISIWESALSNMSSWFEDSFRSFTPVLTAGESVPLILSVTLARNSWLFRDLALRFRAKE